jgi:hypothetical protein
MDRLKYSGLDKENLADLVSIIISVKNKYGIVPYALAAHGQPIPTGAVATYLIDSLGLNKMLSVLMDTPRLESVTIVPRGIPRSRHFEMQMVIGG